MFITVFFHNHQKLESTKMNRLKMQHIHTIKYYYDKKKRTLKLQKT